MPSIRYIDHGDSIADLLEMVANKAPLFMRVGGCGLTTDERPTYRLPEQVRERFAELFRQGKTLHQIATETGCPYPTVVKHTRALRKAA